MDLTALFDEVRAAGPDPDLPLVLLLAMGSDAFTEELLAPEIRASALQSAQAKQRCFADFVALMPQAELRRIDDAGHSGLIWQRSYVVLDAVPPVLREELASCAGAVGLSREHEDFGVVDETVDHAATTTSSEKVSPHQLKGRFGVTMIEAGSQREAMSWKNGFAASWSKGDVADLVE
jgi:hypothetical protein